MHKHFHNKEQACTTRVFYLAEYIDKNITLTRKKKKSDKFKEHSEQLLVRIHCKEEQAQFSYLGVFSSKLDFSLDGRISIKHRLLV